MMTYLDRAWYNKMLLLHFVFSYYIYICYSIFFYLKNEQNCVNSVNYYCHGGVLNYANYLLSHGRILKHFKIFCYNFCWVRP